MGLTSKVKKWTQKHQCHQRRTAILRKPSKSIFKPKMQVPINTCILIKKNVVSHISKAENAMKLVLTTLQSLIDYPCSNTSIVQHQYYTWKQKCSILPVCACPDEIQRAVYGVVRSEPVQIQCSHDKVLWEWYPVRSRYSRFWKAHCCRNWLYPQGLAPKKLCTKRYCMAVNIRDSYFLYNWE